MSTKSTAKAGGSYTTARDVCEAFPARVARLFDALDLTRPELASVKHCFDDGDLPTACTALLDYYTRQDASTRLLPMDWPDIYLRTQDPALLLENTFPYIDWTHPIPVRPDGGWYWTFCGPSGEDNEFGWSINRHYHLLLAFETYQKTGDERYRTFLDSNLQDWLIALPPYPNERNHSPQWRGLEVATRLHNWPGLFYAMNGAALSPATRLLMLATIPDHAHYNATYHAGGGNWVVIEMEGLASAALAWPEFRDVPAWWAYAIKTSEKQLGMQVYPDGLQTELTSHYHTVVAHQFLQAVYRARMAGESFSDNFIQTLERMWEYVAYAEGPDLTLPHNNDSDRLDRVKYLEQGLMYFDRPDWRYIMTNGREGVAPQRPYSVFYPWAGHAIMRDGWGEQAQWAFFDVGPLGAGHDHVDKLHLSIRAGGRDLLVDSGRYAYLRDPFRDYVVSSPAHNTLMIDDAPQKPFARKSEAPIEGTHVITEAYDYFRGVFGAGYEGVSGEVIHTRVVVYMRGAYWVVVDRIATDRPRRVNGVWHFSPQCTVSIEGTDAVTVDPDACNLRISPVGDLTWNGRIVTGQREPEIQGWYSPGNNAIVPAPTVIFTGTIEQSTAFAWILTPGQGLVSPIRASFVSKTADAVVVSIGNQQLTIPLTGTPQVTIETH